MSRISFDEKNFRHCRCPYCPVQEKSACIKEKLNQLKDNPDKTLPTPENTPSLYCSSGKASCAGLVEKERCICPSCLVWSEYDLSALYYCFKGNADENG